MISELSRVLKKGGKLILTYPTIDQTIIAKLEKFFHIRDLTSVSEHLTEWDYKRIIKQIERYNFKFLKARGIVFDLGRFGKIQKISKNMMRKVLKFKLGIKNCPKNSLFVAFEFEKI